MRLDTNIENSSGATTERPGRKRDRARADRKDSPTNGAGHAATNGLSREPTGSTHGARTPLRESLTASQIERLEQRLLEEWRRALRTLWAKREDIEDHREVGALDRVEMEMRMVERHSEFITMIQEALQRLRESPGDFDVSVVSGARIPFERLELVPWTRRLTEEVGHD